MKLAIKRLHAKYTDGKLAVFGAASIFGGFLCGKQMVGAVAEGRLMLKAKSGQTSTILVANEPGLFLVAMIVLALVATALAYAGVLSLIAAMSTRQSEKDPRRDDRPIGF